MKVHKSNVCRIPLTPEIIAIATAGIVQIGPEILPPRQIRITKTDISVLSRLVYHRDAYIPTISAYVAEELVNKGCAQYEPQSLLFFTMEQYLADPDVLANQEEYTLAKSSGADLVLVAVIGQGRSALTVCRNIVSGCQDQKDLNKNAQEAIDNASVFLIE